MPIKVGVVGYGTIGKRVADAVAMQKDMKLVGVTAHSYSFNTEVAKQKGYKLFTMGENDLKLKDGDDIEVIGKVQEYNGKKEIVAQKVRMIK